MRQWMRRGLVLCGVVLLSAQVVRPERSNPAVERQRAIEARYGLPPSVSALLDRACRDCHSNETRWPWYSAVAPISWFVIDHVNHGRSHFNYSEWARYDAEEGRRLLKRSCELARNVEMPLASYAAVHRSARLSPADVAALCSWAAAVTGEASRE